VSVCVLLLIVARQRLGKHVPAATNTRNNRRIVGEVVFWAAPVVSKESRRLVLLRTSCYISLLLILCYQLQHIDILFHYFRNIRFRDVLNLYFILCVFVYSTISCFFPLLLLDVE
jgi:hypothetical protein